MSFEHEGVMDRGTKVPVRLHYQGETGRSLFGCSLFDGAHGRPPARSPRSVSLRPLLGNGSWQLDGERGAALRGRFRENPAIMRRYDLRNDEQAQTDAAL